MYDTDQEPSTLVKIEYLCSLISLRDMSKKCWTHQALFLRRLGLLANSRHSVRLQYGLVLGTILWLPPRIRECERRCTREAKDDLGLIAFANIDDDRVAFVDGRSRDRMNMFDPIQSRVSQYLSRSPRMLRLTS